VHAVLSGVLGQAARDGLLVANPCARVKPPKRTADEAIGDICTEDELRTFLDHVRDDRLYTMLRTLAATGCRRGGVLALKWTDLSPAGELSVRASVSRHHDDRPDGTPPLRTLPQPR
jgi:integrase